MNMPSSSNDVAQTSAPAPHATPARPVGLPPAASTAEPARFIGRAAELETLQHFVDDSSESVLLVAGPVGSGRSRLLRELQRSRADRVFYVRHRAATSSDALPGLSSVLRALGISGHDAMAGQELHAEADPVAQIRTALADALGTATREIVVLIDDLDRQDPRTQDAIAALGTEHRGGPVRVIAAVAAPSDDDRFGDLPTVRLDAMTDDELVLIASALTDHRLDPATAGLVARLSGGLPGALHTHVARLSGAQRSGAAALSVPLRPAFPAEVGTAQIRHWLDADSWHLLQLVATAPAVSIAALPELVGDHLDGVELLIALGHLSREAGYVSVTLPELRSELYWEMSSPARRSAHAAANRAEGSADPDLRDWHRSHVTSEPTTSSSLYAAATSLLRKGLTPAAFEVAERALGFVGVGSSVQQQLDFARELLMHGYAELAMRHVPHERAVMSRKQLFVRERLLLEKRAFLDGDLGVESVDALVGQYRGELPEECAELLALAGLLLIMDGAIEQGLSRVDSAAALCPPEPVGVSLHHWVDRLCRAMRLGSDGSGHAGVGVRSDAPAELRVAAGLAMMWEERHAEAREQFAIVRNGRRGTRSPWASRAAVAAVENELRAGELSNAADLARRLRPEPGAAGLSSPTLLAWIALQQGRFDEADELIRRCEAHPGADRRWLATRAIALLRGSSALLRGETAEAVIHLRAAVGSGTGPLSGVLRGLPELAEALWRNGDPAGAAAVTNRMADAVAAAPTRWGRIALARCRAMLADDAAGAFVPVLSMFEGAEHPFARARTHAAAAAAAAAAGLAETAAAEKHAAAELFERLGATAWAELVMRSTGSVEPRRRELPSLTDSELAVLRLARRGAPNREIAAVLFMSLRSVELQLTRIYRKFGVRSRTQLLSLLSEDHSDNAPRSIDA